MKIRIHKKGNRNQLVCIRSDGSSDATDLGPTLPFHDIAHYVVESELKLQSGFYGNISKGYTVKQLSDKAVIKTLSQESLISEIITRALQSMQSGAINEEQFPELVNEEFRMWSIKFSLPEPQSLKRMIETYDKLIAQWNSISEGESLELIWI